MSNQVCLRCAALDSVGGVLQGDVATLGVLLPGLTHLGLPDNLLGSWRHVHAISEHLSSLTTLNLSGNRLEGASALVDLPVVTTVRALVLNTCHMAWEDALAVGHCYPELRELYFCENSISTLHLASPAAPATDAVAAAFPHLQLLDLMDNKLAGWQAVEPLARLQHLTELKLSNNPLGGITASSTQLACFSSQACTVHAFALECVLWYKCLLPPS
jgi:Leucine-rich repeat (LRR) protein